MGGRHPRRLLISASVPAMLAAVDDAVCSSSSCSFVYPIDPRGYTVSATAAALTTTVRIGRRAMNGFIMSNIAASGSVM